jgi:hypothetical protein
MADPQRRIGFMERIREQYEKKGRMNDLETEARREEIIQRIAEARARVRQEVAIARRLETAAVVEIEESYDYRGDGQVGLQLEGKEVNLGINGSGAKVFKRTYRFSGWKGEAPAAEAAAQEPAPATEEAASVEPAAAEASASPQPEANGAVG